MTPEWLAWPYSATWLLVSGAVGFMLGIAVGSMVATVRARRLPDRPSRRMEGREFWREEERPRPVAVAPAPASTEAEAEAAVVTVAEAEAEAEAVEVGATAMAVSSDGPALRSDASASLTSSIASMPSAPIGSRVEVQPSKRSVVSSRIDVEPDPIALMTDAEIDAMAAEVPTFVPGRRRKPAAGPKHTVHRL